MALHSYSSIANLGHRSLQGLFDGPVVVEEKVDGSQFSFGLAPDGQGNWQLYARSKGAALNLEEPEKMFAAGVTVVKQLAALLTPGWTYRGEYLAKPKHNALAYDRIPANHVILFDVDKGDQDYMTPAEKRAEAERLGLESVPTIFEGVVPDAGVFRAMLDTVSVLGGQKIEGVVIKPAPGRDFYGADHKLIMGKFVSEAFREVHSKSWSDANPGGKDIIAILASKYGTQARWQKAVQHLRERGEIEDDVRDIGKIMREVPADVLKEEKDAIAAELFEWGWGLLKRKLTSGTVDWYKDALLRSQFEADLADGLAAIKANGEARVVPWDEVKAGLAIQ